MSWGPLLVNLAVTAGLVAVLMLATFAYAMRTRVHAIMDTIWPLGFVLIALVSFLLSAGSGVAGRRTLVLVLTAIWGLRLGAHIHSRNRGQGEDKRYASLLRRNRGSLAAFALRYIYWMQGRVMWFVSLPVQAEYADYVRRTSGFIPWPPTRLCRRGIPVPRSAASSRPAPGPARRPGRRQAAGADRVAAAVPGRPARGTRASRPPPRPRTP
jgi:steroid 5-alpha reductase family enzyme